MMDPIPPNSSVPQPETLVIAGEKNPTMQNGKRSNHSDQPPTYTQPCCKSSFLCWGPLPFFMISYPSPPLKFRLPPSLIHSADTHSSHFMKSTEPSKPSPLYFSHQTSICNYYLLSLSVMQRKCLSLHETHFSPYLLWTEFSLHSGSDCPPKVFISQVWVIMGQLTLVFPFVYYGSYHWLLIYFFNRRI